MSSHNTNPSPNLPASLKRLHEIHFHVVKHTVRPVDVVEIWRDGKMVATIYGDSITGDVRFISNHVTAHKSAMPEGQKPLVYDFSF